MQETVLIAGIPRSGTTLACALLNRLPTALALAEPMDVSAFETLPRGAWADHIRSFAGQVRSDLAGRGVYPTKASPEADNFFSTADTSGLRKDRGRRLQVALERPLEEDFTLLIKHPNAFMAMLPELVSELPLFAMIRNPLAVLGSWNSIQAGFRNGHAPMAERLDHSRFPLAERLQVEDVVQRQLRLLSWYYEMCSRWLGEEQILRYEALVASGGASLSPWVPEAASLTERLENKNRSPLYDDEGLQRLAEALLASDGAYWEFYERDEVLALLS